MSWSEGHDNLWLATDDGQVEIDCGINHGHSRIVAHIHRTGGRASDALALGYVRVRLQRDCSRIGPGSGELRT